MIILLSPAKNLNEARAAGYATTTPRFIADAQELIKTLRSWTARDISDVMKVSGKIAELNVERFAAWQPASGADQAAARMFDGDVYRHLEAHTLSDEGAADAAHRLRILSGLYGLLRPTDDVCAYRLEMGRKLLGHPAGTLYKFWGSKIAQAIVEDAKAAKTDTLLNLASDEYSKSVDLSALGALRVVTPRFEEERNGVRKVISFSAKRARGAMARWALENGITDPADLPGFEAGGYAYDVDTSTPDKPVFLKAG